MSGYGNCPFPRLAHWEQAWLVSDGRVGQWSFLQGWAHLVTWRLSDSDNRLWQSRVGRDSCGRWVYGCLRNALALYSIQDVSGQERIISQQDVFIFLSANGLRRSRFWQGFLVIRRGYFDHVCCFLRTTEDIALLLHWFLPRISVIFDILKLFFI